MKQLKKIGLVALALAALFALLSVEAASATEFYTGTTTLIAGTNLKLSSKGSNKAEDTSGNVLETCTKSELDVTTTNTGGSGVSVQGSASRVTDEGCIFPLIILSTGSVEFHWITGGNALMTTKDFKIQLTPTLFGNCTYSAGTGVTAGTVEGKTFGSATLALNAVLTKVSGLCPSSMRWTATYTFTSPTPLHVTNS